MYKVGYIVQHKYYAKMFIKGFITKKSADYFIKNKLMKANFGEYISQIFVMDGDYTKVIENYTKSDGIWQLTEN